MGGGVGMRDSLERWFSESAGYQPLAFVVVWVILLSMAPYCNSLEIALRPLVSPLDPRFNTLLQPPDMMLDD